MPPVGQMKQIAKTTLKINLCPELIMIPEGVSVSQLPCLSHKQIAEDCCLTIVGSLVTSGSKLGLALDQNADSQFWSMKPDGRIYSKLKPNLVLDVKGKNHLFSLSCLYLTKNTFFACANVHTISSKRSLPVGQPLRTPLHALYLTASSQGPWEPQVTPSSLVPFYSPKTRLRGLNHGPVPWSAELKSGPRLISHHLFYYNRLKITKSPSSVNIVEESHASACITLLS